MEEEYKITIEKYVKEIRETHIKLTKVNLKFNIKLINFHLFILRKNFSV